VASVSTRLERLSGTASRVGAALKEKYSRPRGVSASAAVVNATIQRTKRAHTANLVGVALTAKNLSKQARRIASVAAVSASKAQKRHRNIAKVAGAASTARSFGLAK
jgi:hypothetical protein